MDGINKEWLNKGHMKFIDFIRRIGMSQISGYVKEIFEGKVSRGKSEGKPFWSITLDTDNKLSTFKSEFIQGVEVGKEYTFTVEASGDYVNLTAPTVPCIQQDTETIAPEATTAPLTHELPKSNTGGYTKYSYKETEADYRARQVSIRKAVALKAAVEFATATLGGTSSLEDVIDFAIKFEKYLK